MTLNCIFIDWVERNQRYSLNSILKNKRHNFTYKLWITIRKLTPINYTHMLKWLTISFHCTNLKTKRRIAVHRSTVSSKSPCSCIFPTINPWCVRPLQHQLIEIFNVGMWTLVSPALNQSVGTMFTNNVQQIIELFLFQVSCDRIWITLWSERVVYFRLARPLDNVKVAARAAKPRIDQYLCLW